MRKPVSVTLAIIFTVFIISGSVWSVCENDTKKPLFLLRKNGYAQIKEDIHVFSGEASENMTLIISGKDATIIDTGTLPIDGDIKRGANRLKRMLEEKQLHVRNVINTHYDLDHVSNTARFIDSEPKGSVRFYGPDVTTDGQIIRMGDKVFRVLVTPGHAAMKAGHISIELVNENILVAGDVLYTNFIPCMMLNDSPKAYINTLERIKKEKYEIIIPGHGNILNADYTVKRPLSYMRVIENKVNSVIEAGGGMAEVRKKIKLEDCFKDVNGVNIKDPYQVDFHRSNLRQMYAELMGEGIGEKQLK